MGSSQPLAVVSGIGNNQTVQQTAGSGNTQSSNDRDRLGNAITQQQCHKAGGEGQQMTGTKIDTAGNHHDRHTGGQDTDNRILVQNVLNVSPLQEVGRVNGHHNNDDHQHDHQKRRLGHAEFFVFQQVLH